MNEQIVDRVFLTASAVSLFNSLVFYFLLTSLSVYAVERFAADETLAGFSATSFILGAVAARLASARLMRLAGRRVAIASAALLSVLFVSLYPAANETWQLIALRLLHGAMFGVVSTLLASGVLSRAHAHQRAQVAGYFGLPSTLATATGPLLAVFIISTWGYQSIFMASTACCVIAAICAVILKFPQDRANDDPTFTDKVSRGARLQTSELRGLLNLAVVIFLVGFAYAGVIAYLAPYSLTRDAEWSVGVYFALYAGFAVVGRVGLGRIQDRFGDNVIAIPILLSFTLSLALIAVASNGFVISVAGVFMGLGFGMVLPTMQAAASKVVQPVNMNSAVAAVYVSIDLGVGVAPFALGPVIGFFGYSGMYFALGGVVLLATVLYLTGHGRSMGGAQLRPYQV